MRVSDKLKKCETCKQWRGGNAYIYPNHKSCRACMKKAGRVETRRPLKNVMDEFGIERHREM